MPKDSGDGPSSCSMLRRERRSTLEKMSLRPSLIGSFPSEGIFHCLDYDQAVQRGLSREQTGLAPMFVARGITQQPHPSSTTHQCANAGIGNIVVVTDGLGIERQMLTNVAIGHQQASQTPQLARAIAYRRIGAAADWSRFVFDLAKNSFPIYANPATFPIFAKVHRHLTCPPPWACSLAMFPLRPSPPRWFGFRPAGVAHNSLSAKDTG